MTPQEEELQRMLTQYDANPDNPRNHPEDCDCDDCGIELHSAHVTLDMSGLFPQQKRPKRSQKQYPRVFQIARNGN